MAPGGSESKSSSIRSDEQRAKTPPCPHRDPVCHLAEHLAEAGILAGSACAVPARPSEQTVRGTAAPQSESAEVPSDRWSAARTAYLLDLRAEELHPERVFFGRREHVENSAADGDLAPVSDEVYRQ